MFDDKQKTVARLLVVIKQNTKSAGQKKISINCTPVIRIWG